MSQEIRRDKTPIIPNWEEGISSEKDASIFVKSIELRMKRAGLGDISKASFLEIGAGNGKLSAALRSKGCSVKAMDARPRGEGVDIGVVEDMTDSDELYDVVIGFGVFDSNQYRQNQQKMVDQISRVLKKGGLFIGYNVRMDEGVLIHPSLEIIPDPNNVGGLLLKKKIS
jgi:2-polyprenyl-3-methyl-5-hydroxy-6-metoxy-1,4-benzoquinol methylase